MTASDHPSYPNPTIQEAVCDIIFRPQGGTWDPLAFGQFIDRVKIEFPLIEAVPVPMFNLQIGVNIGQNPSPSVQAQQIFRFKHKSRPLLLQLSENRIAVHVIGNYPGWVQFKKDIEYTWKRVVDVIHPEAILRVGLRYINRIERSAPGETPGKWFASTDYVPQAILNSHPGFLFQIQVRPSESERISVVIAEINSPAAHGAFVFDIDRALERETSADLVSLLVETERLHHDVWEVFSSAKTDKLERLLKGDLS